jgi:Rnl2 family RNA ligase
VAQEKIHGSNIQIAIDPNGSWQVFSRKQKINQGDRFQGVDVYDLVEKEYSEFLYLGDNLAKKKQTTIRFYGELFGPRIQKGVDYGDKTRILLFDISVGESFISPHALEEAFRLYTDNYTVPIVGVYSSLKDALAVDTKKDSLVLGKENNIMEGVVIKPYYRVFSSPQGSIFYLKKKNDEFKEKQRAKKEPQDNSVISGLNLEFMSYLTDQKLQNIFSKYGEIQEPSQIGDYIKYMLEDAKEDFCKDFEDDLVQLDKKELKKVYNAGSRIANMLKGYL